MPQQLGNDFGRILIIIGAVLIGAGLLMLYGARLPLGRLGSLPGDLSYRRGNFSAYFPIATSILVSVMLTAIIWLFKWLSRK